MKIFFFISSIICIQIFFVRSNNTKTENTINIGEMEKITYMKNIKPIIDEHCGNKCHNDVRKAGGIALTNYVSVKKETLNGFLIQAIQHNDGVSPMPKKAKKLDQIIIDLIIVWVAQGALE